MFYSKQPSDALRFGDVIKGFFSTIPVVKEPPFALSKKYSIDVNLPEFFAIMDPCCQIGKLCISLTPLIPIQNQFFDNPYLADDLTRINRTMEPQQSVSPQVWTGFTDEEREKRLQVGKKYAFVNLFLYESNDLLTPYTVNNGHENIQTRYYMIDFRNCHKVNCDKIISAQRAPLHLKVIELSRETRQELRDKLSSYFASVPDEDLVDED